MPYNYVTYDRFMSGIGDIPNCGDKEDRKWTEADYVEFKESLKAADALLDDDKWDIKKYVRFDCEQDVRILREGFNVFRRMIEIDFHLDVAKIHSSSSLAYQCLLKNVFLKEDGIKATSGMLDTFIREAIVGGRCMVRDNMAFHVTDELVDFDSVSLYPSAMSTMKVPLGTPEPFEKEIPQGSDYYVVEIILRSVGKHRHQPLIRIEVDGENVWTDDERVINKHFIIDKMTLEDWIEFQQIDYEVVRGASWSSGTTDRLANYIKTIFERRKQLKAEKNPLEKVYKLILNSIYGKTIQKPYNTQKVIIPSDKVADFVNTNYNFLAPNDYVIAGSNLHIFEKYKSIKNVFSFSLIGVMTLSHSKHLMNRVICLAEDLDIPVYYQDTDSIHIPRDRLLELSVEFEKKYGSKLIGSNLCQFHSDFSSKKLESICPDKEIYAKESIFLFKKGYIDVLTADGTAEVDLHIRLKGITPQSIQALADREFNGDIKSIYLTMFNDPERKIQFNLADGKPSFEITDEFQIYSRSEFIREVSTPTSIQRLECSHHSN